MSEQPEQVSNFIYLRKFLTEDNKCTNKERKERSKVWVMIQNVNEIWTGRQVTNKMKIRH